MRSELKGLRFGSSPAIRLLAGITSAASSKTSSIGQPYRFRIENVSALRFETRILPLVNSAKSDLGRVQAMAEGHGTVPAEGG